MGKDGDVSWSSYTVGSKGSVRRARSRSQPSGTSNGTPCRGKPGPTTAIAGRKAFSHSITGTPTWTYRSSPSGASKVSQTCFVSGVISR
jgi:hypothetical protein